MMICFTVVAVGSVDNALALSKACGQPAGLSTSWHCPSANFSGSLFSWQGREIYLRWCL